MEFNDQFSIQRDLEVITRFFKEDLEVLERFYKYYPQYMGFINLQLKNCIKDKKKYGGSFVNLAKKIKSMDDPPISDLAFIAQKVVDADINEIKEYDRRDIINESINKELIQINDSVDILYSLLNKIIKKDLLSDKKHDFLYERCGSFLCRLSNLTQRLDILSIKGHSVDYKQMDKIKIKCFDFWGKLDDEYQKKFNDSPPNEKEFQKNGFDFRIFQE